MAVYALPQLSRGGPDSPPRLTDGAPPSLKSGSKRKAEAPPGPRRRGPSSSAWWSRSTPEPLSINDILRQHSQSRLYVSPIRWTFEHLELLGCRFAKRRRSPRNGQSGTKSVATRSQRRHQAVESRVQAITIAADHLLDTCTTEFKNLAVRDLLDDYGFCHLK